MRTLLSCSLPTAIRLFGNRVRVFGRSITSRGGLSRLSIAGLGAWLEMISIAGPSASEITFTERRMAAEPGLGPVDAGGDCARPRPAPSSPASSERRKMWRPMRGKDFISRGKGYVDRTISLRLGAGEVTEGGRRASDLGRLTAGSMVRREIRIHQSRRPRLLCHRHHPLVRLCLYSGPEYFP